MLCVARVLCCMLSVVCFVCVEYVVSECVVCRVFAVCRLLYDVLHDMLCILLCIMLCCVVCVICCVVLYVL